MKLSLANLAPLKEIEFDSPAPEGMDIPNFDSLVDALKWKNDLENYSMDLEHELKHAQRQLDDKLSGQGERGAEPEGGPIQQKIAGELNQIESNIKIFKKELNTVLAKLDYFDQNYLDEGQKIGKTSYKTRTAINTAPGKTEDKEVMIDNTDDLNNVTIKWRGANHHGNKTLTNLKFTKENEFDDDLMAFSNDSKWLFIVMLDEETDEPDWDTLMVNNRELEHVDDDGNSTYSVPPEDMINEDKELDDYQKSIAAKWDKESKKLGGGLFDTSRELEKTDTKQFNINVNNKLEFLTDLNNAGKFRKKGGYSDDQIENWTINPSLTGSTIASKIKPKTKLKEAYSEMYEDMQDEGSCGHGPDGVPGDTPGETKGMPADNRTRTMLRKLIQKEIAKLHETDYADRLANSGTDSDGRDTWGYKTGYSDEEMRQGRGKLKTYPDKDGLNVWGDKVDYSDAEKKAKGLKANEDYKPSHRAYNVIDKSDNDKIVANGKELSRDRALEKAHTNPNYMIVATDKLAEEGENQSLDKKLKRTGIFSDEEWDKITNKPVPSFADFKSKGHEVAPIMKQIFKKR